MRRCSFLLLNITTPQLLNIATSQPLHNTPRRIRHLQHIGHVARRAHVQDRVRDAVRARRLDLEHGCLQRARIERHRLARLQVNREMWIAALEIQKQLHQPVHVVVGARDVVPAAEVDPLHLRQQIAELRLEPRQHLAQLLHPLLAQAVEVKAVKKVKRLKG